MYDRSWPIWTYQEQLPPAEFVRRLRQGLVIGEDAQADAQRSHRTPSGVVLVTQAMLDKAAA